MNKIIIRRLPGVSGKAFKMICFVDNVEICRIKENDVFIYETDKTLCEFKCLLFVGTNMSDEYMIDFRKSETVDISIKCGMKKPEVVVDFKDAPPEMLKHQTIPTEITTLAEKKAAFNPTKKIGDSLYIDEVRKQWAVPTSFLARIKNVYSYSDIVNFELLEDGNSISSGGAGRAFVGGMLFGDTGAIVGAVTGKHKTRPTCTILQIKITVNDTSNPVEFIKLISSETNRNSIFYKMAFKRAQQIMSMLEVMCNQTAEEEILNNEKEFLKQNDISNQLGGADEISKYKELLDKGVITEEEFNAKKKQILGI